VVNDKLNRKRGSTETKSTNMHTIPAKSNHNKHLIMQHVPKAMMEKLPRVTLA